MSKQTKAQVTLFILIALVVVIIIAVAAYIFQRSSTETARTASRNSQDIPLEVQTINNYVTACLDKTLADGLYLIGQQGGRIYDNQGGPTLPLQLGETYVTTSNPSDPDTPPIKVWYGITRLSLTTNLDCGTSPVQCRPSTASGAANPYPSDYPINSDVCDTSIPTIGCLGRTNRLNNQGLLDFTKQLADYITYAIPSCLDFTEFENQGYEITPDLPPVAEVTLTDSEATAVMYYDLAVVDPTTEKQSYLTEFYVERPTKLRKLYTFAQQIALQDVTSAAYNINSASNPSDAIAVGVVHSSGSLEINPSSDSIVQINDTTNEFTFQFARQNRVPVIGDLSIISFTSGPTKSELDAQIAPQIYDPDETVPTIKYLDSLTDPNEIGSVSCGDTIIVCASDSALPCHPSNTSKDWETITITC